ncbi:hypothetical protein H5410_053736 [Solanum commersonii]|uniref:Uncharacterized protein n=1 Tax=Solanum commersonii TaxID=4109 RepID=A0A9J5X6P6_SOLCO|nr:hypothetical protein H5410_053736 [Solanum commersonii]
MRNSKGRGEEIKVFVRFELYAPKFSGLNLSRCANYSILTQRGNGDNKLYEFGNGNEFNLNSLTRILEECVNS